MNNLGLREKLGNSVRDSIIEDLKPTYPTDEKSLRKKGIYEKALSSGAGRKKFLRALIRPVLVRGFKEHIKNIHLETGIPLKDLLFFDVDIFPGGFFRLMDVSVDYENDEDDIKTMRDGNMYMAYDSKKFIDLMQSNCYAFGKTEESAIKKLKKKMNE